ncbi:MAG TPA: hypothetical protein VFC99_18105 [Acidimicrobiia bacterium]|nr:hypothetical protein [Acidimicrobiia bacterium]
MSGSGGILSVPSEHLPGLVALVAAPAAAWLAVRAVGWLARRGIPSAPAIDRRLRELTLFQRLTLLALVAGAAVHLALVPTHWGGERVLASLFAADALGFLAAAALLLAGRRSWRAVSLAMLGGTAGAYLFYLLEGWESADAAGILTTSVELAAALLLAVPEEAAALPRRQRWWAAAAAPVALLTLLGTAAIAGVPAVDTVSAEGTGGHRAAGSTGAMPGMGGASSMRQLALPTDSPAGPITWPVAMDPEMRGMSMVTPDCSTPPTAAQQKAAVDLVNRTTAAVAPYRSLAAARAAGYVPITPTGRKVVHYVNFSIARQGHPLDPGAVPVLVYVNTRHGAVLSAAMYLATGSTAAGPPQPGGCLMEWHTHTNLCFDGSSVVGSEERAGCAAGTAGRVTRPMMHVWMAPVPGGPLAPDPGPLAEVVAAAQLPPLPTPNGTA